MTRTLKTIFSQFRYIGLALFSSLVVFTFAIWLPNLKLIYAIVFASNGSFLDKSYFLLTLFGSIKTNMNTLSAFYIITISILFGINMAITFYYLKIRAKKIPIKGTVAGVSGFITGLFGIGCASCGAFLLSSIIGYLGTIKVLSILPLHGGEFGILGFILLSSSIYWTVKSIHKPLVCN